MAGLQEQITEARKHYTDEEIYEHISKSKKYGPQIEKAKEAGHSDLKIMEHILGTSKEQSQQPMPWKAQHPNIYGAWGAAKETGKSVLPYVKYIDPEEREVFMQLSQQHQTRELLMEALFAAMIGRGKEITVGAGALLKQFMPKTYARLTKPLFQKKTHVPGVQGATVSSGEAALAEQPGVVHVRETPRPKPKVGDTVELEKYGKVKIIDDSDPSLIVLQNEQGSQIKLGKSAYKNMLKAESIVEKDIISEIFKTVKENPEGFTINVKDAKPVLKGFAVAPAKETETAFVSLTENDVRSYVRQFQKVFDAEPEAKLGGWLRDDGKFVLDVSYVVDDYKKAVYIAEIGEQDGIFNITKGQFIETKEAVQALKASGTYRESERAELGGLRELLRRSIPQSGAAEGLAPPLLDRTELIKQDYAKGILGKEKPPLPKEKVLRLEEQKRAIEEAINYAVKNPDDPLIKDQSLRAFRKVAKWISEEDIDPHALRDLAIRYNMSPEQLATEFVYAGTYAGRILGNLSHFAKALKKAFPKDKKVRAAIASLERGEKAEQGFIEAFFDLYRKVDNPRRMLMVSQLATAQRNAISQAGRVVTNIFDDAIKGTVKTILPQKMGGAHPAEAYANLISDFTAVVHKLSPTQRVKLETLFNKYPEEAGRLFTAPIHDITLTTKVARGFMFLNRAQEYFFRKLAFDARLTALCKKAKIDPYKDIVPDEMLDDAVKYALDATFAGKPPGGNFILRAYKEVPLLTLVNPYPRFWVNAVKFLWEYNPTGMLSAASQAIYRKSPEKAIEHMAKATTGTLMLGMALMMRNSDMAGERWYEIKTGTNSDGSAKYLDTRAFAPWSTYLYIADEMLKSPAVVDMLNKVLPGENFKINSKQMRWQDRMQAIVGINRIAGTGLVVIDLLRAERPETFGKALKEVIGQWLGGFSVPFRSIKDIEAGLATMEDIPESFGVFSEIQKGTKAVAQKIGGERESEVQYTREHPVVGPFATNLPLSQEVGLEQAPRLTRGEGYVREQTGLRQATGITVKTKYPLEREIDRLALDTLWPRTGDPTLDRKILEKAGVEIEKLNNFVRGKKYARMDDDERKFALRKGIHMAMEDIKSGKITVGKDGKPKMTPGLIPAYHSNKLREIKDYKERVKYILDLVDRNKLSATNLSKILVMNPQMFTKKDMAKIGKKKLLK